MFAYAVSLSGETSRAEDLVQETVLRALIAKNVPCESAGLRPWLFRILRNAFLDGLRRDDRLQFMNCDDLTAEAEVRNGFESQRDTLVEEISVRFALADLSVAKRDILCLIDVLGFSYLEAAEILAVPVGTVMSRISRAREALLAKLSESNVTPLRARNVRNR